MGRVRICTNLHNNWWSFQSMGVTIYIRNYSFTLFVNFRRMFFFILYKGFILLRIFLGELVDLVVEGLGKIEEF